MLFSKYCISKMKYNAWHGWRVPKCLKIKHFRGFWNWPSFQTFSWFCILMLLMYYNWKGKIWNNISYSGRFNKRNNASWNIQNQLLPNRQVTLKYNEWEQWIALICQYEEMTFLIRIYVFELLEFCHSLNDCPALLGRGTCTCCKTGGLLQTQNQFGPKAIGQNRHLLYHYLHFFKYPHFVF